MVFQGRWSTGCYLCRKRKIKCDETKPDCQRCIAYGKKCPGYRDALVVRVENDKVKRRSTTSTPKSSSGAFSRFRLGPIAQKPPTSPSSPDVPPRLTTPPPLAFSENGSDDDDEVEPSDAEEPHEQIDSNIPSEIIFNIPPAPNPCYEQLSLCYFTNQYIVFGAGDHCPGHLEYLPELLSRQGSQECLKLALQAVAYLSVYNRWGGSRFYLAARKNYGATMAAVKQLLTSRETALSDELFCTVFLLHMFVDLSGERDNLYNPHTAGLFHLMRLRGVEQLTTKRGLSMWGLAYTQLQIQSFLSDEHQYDDLEQWSGSVEHLDHIFRARAISSRVAHFCTLTIEHCRLLKNSPDGISDTQQADFLSKMLERACYLMVEFERWNRDIPKYWPLQQSLEQQKNEEGTEQLQSETKPQRCDSQEQARDQITACVLTLFHACQIVFCIRILECCRTLNTVVSSHARISTLSPVSPTSSVHPASPVFRRDSEASFEQAFSSPTPASNNESDSPPNPAPTPCPNTSKGTEPATSSNTSHHIVPPNAILGLESRISTLINSVVNLIPYALGDIDRQGNARTVGNGKSAGAYQLLWPMYLVAHCPYSSAEQMDRSTETLSRIGSQLGIRGALALKEIDLPNLVL